MGEFKVHHVRFFEYTPQAINSLAYEKSTQRLAVSRSDGSIEIWSKADNWYQEKVIPGTEGHSVEALVWLGTRLFSGGLDSNVTEYDLVSLQMKNEADNQLAAGTEDGCVVIFSTDGDDLQHVRAFDKQEGRILCIAWHTAEGLVVTGGIDNIRIWGAQSGHALQRLTLGRQDRGKETIVWCLAVTSDLTIVSGDSRGKTSFWNGKQGTLIKSIQSHKADVLTVAVDEEETNVFSSGVDPTVVKFSYMSPSGNSSWRTWVRSTVLSYHTHDVRACVVAGSTVVTGGTGTSLICSEVDSSKKKKFTRLPALPSHSMVSVAAEAGLLLLRYSTYLELWRLGHTTSSSNVNGEILSLRSKPLKLLQLKARPGETIVCSAISPDGTVVAFSDQEKIRVHKLTLTDLSSLTPSVKVSRISLSASHNSQPAHRLAITSDGSHIIAASGSPSLQIWDISSGSAALEHTLCPATEKREPFTVLTVSDNGRYAATACAGGSVHLYDIKDGQVVHHQATALSFTPGGRTLLVTYTDHTVYEFDVGKQEYTSWSRSSSHRFPKQWLQQRGCLRRVTCRPGHTQQVFLCSEQTMLAINRSQPMPEGNYSLLKGGNQTSTTDQPRPLIACSKYKFILHMDFLSEDTLVVVERTPMAIQDTLPPTLRQKKFGT
ncbi:hypothetical protein BaRGS_00003435 [Batillaria attramentaria]|uniref:Uncharacterized protein n=1 Tax=Batillaria attramentaria TaxID=370345 RepID=A0ABD0M1I6_9CAEN